MQRSTFVALWTAWAIVVAATSTVIAQDDTITVAMAEADRLQTALERRLTVWRTREGNRVYVRYCRASRPGCEARIAALSRLFVSVGRRHGLDPYLLAALAIRESGLSPFAEGGIGERGIVQLHPRGVGRRSRFVRSESYRRLCRNRADACQQEVLEIGAEHLQAWIARCGSLNAGLGGYNSGRCDGNPDYTRRVLRELERLRGNANDA